MPARARRLAAVKPVPEPERAPDLRDAVKAAIGDMTWLSGSDKALAALALRQAEEIEKAVERAELLADIPRTDDNYKRLQKLEAMCDVTKTVGWLGPQLQGVLRDLGGTPAARKALQPDQPVGGRLAQLRASAGQHDS